jgi:cytochrome c oxidase subunit 3
MKDQFKLKRIFKKGGFKKNYFFYSKYHQKYIDFDKKHNNSDSHFLYSKFLTYINEIPFSRAPFFFAMYLGTIVPQMFILFKRLPDDGSKLNWVKGILFLCLGYSLLTLFFWFFDLFIEASHIGKHNQKINASFSYGFTIFMLSEVCIFAGLFWGFFDRAFHPSVSLQSLYMPSGTHGLPSLALIFKGSFLLSLSCSAFNAMKRCLMLGNNNRARFWGFLSFCIGLTFLFQQVEEYESIPYMMSLNAHCSFFYAITGLHGFHVALGILFIGTIVDRIEQEKFNQYELMSVTYAEIYWYFVDLVWFVLLLALYAYGIYHPNCVLIEKYTPIDEFKDIFFSFGYILKDMLENFYFVFSDFYDTWLNKIENLFRSLIYDFYFNFIFLLFNSPKYFFSMCFFFFCTSFINFIYCYISIIFIIEINFFIFYLYYLLFHPIFFLKLIFSNPLFYFFFFIFYGFNILLPIY